MPRSKDSCQLDLSEVFARVQTKLLADLSLSLNFEHPTASGTATELIWLDLFRRYLPTRYRAIPAFVINAQGQRSRQIDIAIIDNLHAPLLFPHAAGDHVPIESVYAVFEVKSSISNQWILDAAEKAASVRDLHTTKRKVVAGFLATSSIWKPSTFPRHLTAALADLPPNQQLNCGCALEHGSFYQADSLIISTPDRALITFLVGLITSLQSLGPTKPPNLLNYLHPKKKKPKR